MRDAEPGEPPHHQIVQVRVGDQGRRDGRLEDFHRRPGVRVKRRRQLDERFDRTVSEGLSERHVLVGDLGVGRVWRPFDADLPQVAEGGLDRAGGAARGVKDVDLGAGDGGAIGEGPRAPRQHREPPLGGRGVAAQMLAFGPIEGESEGELVAFLPAVVGEEVATGAEVGERRGIGRGVLGLLARRQIERRHARALLGRGDQGRAPVRAVSRSRRSSRRARRAAFAPTAGGRSRGAAPASRAPEPASRRPPARGRGGSDRNGRSGASVLLDRRVEQRLRRRAPARRAIARPSTMAPMWAASDSASCV